MLKPPLQLKYSPPTTPSLPPLHRIHCYSASDPNQWLWGGKVRTLTLTPDSPNTWDFALKKRRIRVFQNDMHTWLHPECAAEPQFFACVSTWVTHTVNSLGFLWMGLRCVLQGGTKWRCTVFMCSNISEQPWCGSHQQVLLKATSRLHVRNLSHPCS